MYLLTNDELEIAILDPVTDQARFGPRYCTGGYIFRITDVRHGPLLSGPTYPASFNWFDGQGLPDAFNLRPLHEPTAPSPLALIIGVGICDLQHKLVQEFCSWEIVSSRTRISMRTTQAFHGFALVLERTLTLSSRTIHSTTHLKNTGQWPIPICWFPHPFFPQPNTPDLCRLNVPVHMPENPGYAIGENGFIRRKIAARPEGDYQALDHAAQTPLVVLQRHPALGLVAATCSYVPSFFPIWGNQHTFSWEPFFERTVAVGQETMWGIVYDF